MASRKKSTSKYKPRYDSHHVRLKTGEGQLDTGAYVYRWTDNMGKRRAVYAPTLEQLREPLNELMCALRDEVNRQEGIIGHIKAFVEDSGASISMSCTDDEIYVTKGKERKTVFHFAAILFAVEEDPIVELMDDAFSEM